MKITIIDLKTNEDGGLLLDAEMLSSIGINKGENLKLLMTEDTIMVMSPENFGEKMIKK